MEVHMSLDEIIDTLKKVKSADPADCHHQDIVKQDIATLGRPRDRGGRRERQSHRDGDGEQRALSEWD